MTKRILLLAAACGLPFLALAEEQIPSRKPGLWEVKITTMQMTQVMQQCTDTATDKQMQAMIGKAGEMCAKSKTSRQGDAYTAETECTIGGSKIKSKAVFKGDFSASYTGEVHSSFNPPLMNMKEDHTQISARWVGPCKADQRPGDVVLPGGMKMNLDSMPKLPGAKQNR